MRRLAIAIGLACAVAATWAAAAAPAGAHAAIESTSPADGALLETPPDELRLSFTEPPDLSLTFIGLVDASGAERSLGPVERLPGEDRQIRAALVDELPDGVYTVTWATVSRTDGHPTSGAFTFGVGVAAGEVPQPGPTGSTETPAPSAESVAGKWMLYVGLAVLFGAAIAGLVALGPSATARGWLLGLAWALAAVGVVAMTLAERAAIGVPLGTLLSSDTGGAYVRLGVAVGVAGLATVAASLRPGRATLLVLAGAAGAAMLARADGGHAGGAATSVIVQWLHLAGAGAWIGGLAWLFLGLRRGLEPAAVRRFSNLAAGGLAVVFVSGVLRSSNELGGITWWLHPFETDYRTALVVKLGLVAPLVALGALNRFRNVRRLEQLGSTPLLRTVGSELALAAAVFAAAGVLTGLPPRGTDATTPVDTPEPIVVTGSDFATTTNLLLQVTPGTVGANDFLAEVTDYDTGEPVDARRVSLTFALPDRPEVGSTLELDRQPDGTWQADGTALAIGGTWDVTVLVETTDGSVDIALEVTPLGTEQRVDVSETPGLPTIYTITMASGFQLQAYVDPGEPGRVNDVHLTAFDPDGAEVPLASAAIEMLAPHGHTLTPEVIRLGPGHFAASLERLDLTPGMWSFAMTATTEDGTVISGSFEQTFEG